ncbi:MAG: hypothetical protein RMK35_03490 [Aquificaceae bacterium]|nr:hypothetical protein [Aquificaceae bacterium]MDW8433850.1 hypothetical protein [Aquificaceae bacterium]
MKARAVALFSGGLDSSLSVRLLQDQGVEVKAIHFYTGFCITEHKRRLGLKKEDGSQYVNPAIRAAALLQVPIDVVDISEEYLGVILNPKHGYGKNVNPCVDCRILMLKKAKEIMEREGYHFVITGEVLGQRPMSQTFDRLMFIEKQANLQGYVLRPLSAKLLPETIPEKLGWVDRERLLDIHGRGRRKQIAMAEKYGIDYEQPAGGCCYLTDENYAYRFKEAFQQEGLITRDDLILFTVGRHFRLPCGAKVILARNEGEVKFLQTFKNRYDYAYRKDHKGTFAIIKGKVEDLNILTGLVARYSKNQPCEVVVCVEGREVTLLGEPLNEELVEAFKIYNRQGANYGT